MKNPKIRYMKKSALVLILLVVFNMLSAQTTNHINYQAVIRNNSGQIISNQTIKLRISILQGSATGTNVYSETHTIQTNDYGLINIEIGGGTLVSGNYSSINWGSNSSFLKLELDANNTGSFADLGTVEILAVPYALYAKTANAVNESDPVFSNSPANGITSSQIENWSTAYSWGNHSGLYRLITWTPSWNDVSGKPSTLTGYGITDAFNGDYNSLTNKPQGNTVGDIQYWNGTNWILLPPGNAGQILTINSSGLPIWQNQLSVPKATTSNATNILSNGVTLNGAVTANGLSTNVSFEYGTSTSYGNTITANQSPLTGYSETNVSASINGLAIGTTYHFRIIASNSLGVVNSNDMTFTTLGQAPTVTSSAASSITSISAQLNGTVNPNFLSTSVVFEYGTSTSYGNTVNASQSPVTGTTSTNVSASITGLAASTLYHFRIVANNTLGTSNSNDMTFTTLSNSQIVDIDGNVYNTINIGTQIWMKENLKTTKYRDGIAITYCVDTVGWTLLSDGAYCFWGNDVSNKNTYGALYNYYSVVSSHNLCPTGWHVPTDNEWSTLETYLGGASTAGGKLKETGTTYWGTPNLGATNESGFTARPGGMRGADGLYIYIGTYGYWWSSTANLSTDAWNRRLYCNSTDVTRSNDNKKLGASVRCIKD